MVRGRWALPPADSNTTRCHANPPPPHPSAPAAVQWSCAAGQVSDVWSVGMMLLELVEGEHPWRKQGLTDIQIMYRLRTLREPPPATTDLGPELHDFLSKCLLLNSSARPSVHQLRNHDFVLQYSPKFEPMSPPIGNNVPPVSPSSLHSQGSSSCSTPETMDVDVGKLTDTILAYQEDDFVVHREECCEVLSLTRTLEPQVWGCVGSRAPFNSSTPLGWGIGGGEGHHPTP